MKFLLLSITLIFSLSSCIYKMDIEQGTPISEEKLAKLSIGMTKNQVIFLLGKPSISDTFNKDKWHYLYTLSSDDASKKTFKTMILDFQENSLIKIKSSY